MRVQILVALAAGAVLVTAPDAATVASAAPAATPAAWSTDARVVHGRRCRGGGYRHPGRPPPAVRPHRHRPGRRRPRLPVRYVRRRTRPVRDARPAARSATLLIVLTRPTATTWTPAEHADDPSNGSWRLDQVRETEVIGDFEAFFTVGVGLAHKAPFRVLTLTNPTRIVVDVQH